MIRISKNLLLLLLTFYSTSDTSCPSGVTAAPMPPSASYERQQQHPLYPGDTGIPTGMRKIINSKSNNHASTGAAVSKMLKSGYSKVSNSQPLLPILPPPTLTPPTSATADSLDFRQMATLSTPPAAPSLPKSMGLRLPGYNQDDDVVDTRSQERLSNREDEDAAALRLSTKDSLAIFMRENLYAAATAAGQSATDSTGGQSATSTYESPQPMAAALRHEVVGTFGDGAEDDAAKMNLMRQDEFSSMMKKRLTAFVKKFMQAEIHEVRVEQRTNGLQPYTAAQG